MSTKGVESEESNADMIEITCLITSGNIFLLEFEIRHKTFVSFDAGEIGMLVRRCETFERSIYRIIKSHIDAPGGTKCFSDVTCFAARRTQHV